MVNQKEHEVIRRGGKVWNKWRQENSILHPLLIGAQLVDADLNGANLRYADLMGANLNGATLINADLVNATLSEADLRGTTLDNANLYKTSLRDANLEKANLRNANLFGANLRRALLINTNLERANLILADLSGASLRGASLIRANLSEADLVFANLEDAKLDEADLTKARIGWTTFGNNDLAVVIGLGTVRHSGPSSIGIDTVYRSKGKIPEIFLRGAGIADNFISYMTSLTEQAFQYYSCFISYSSKNAAFAERLYADLQSKGVRSWFAPEDLKIGDRIRPIIDESIRLYEKLLLVLSEDSVRSQWVEQEVETAMAKEREQGRTVLFPIRLDDSVMKINVGWPALIKNTRHIGDFEKWKDHDAYQNAFGRLLRDLQAELPNAKRT